VIIINGSPHRGGACERKARQLAAQADTAQVFSVAVNNFKPCRGCQSCLRTKRCAITDDDMADLLAQLTQAQELIWVAPSYFGAVPAQLKAVIDRMMVLWAQQQGIASDRGRTAQAWLTGASDRDLKEEALLKPLRYASNTAGFSLRDIHVFSAGDAD
jgi:multimeric flavodoxin WrbA